MRGFTIQAKNETGEECLLNDINANKKIFEVITVKTKPWLILDFLFKKRSTQATMMRKMFSMIPIEKAEDHISEKLIELGARRNIDFSVSVIE